VRKKARFVAKELSQVLGKEYFDTYAPVAKLLFVRTVLALTAVCRWETESAGVGTAFLQSPEEEEVYVKPPKGFEKYGKGGKSWYARYSSLCTV